VLVEHFPVAVGVFLGIVVSVTGIFVFSVPMFRSPIDRTMLDGAAGHRYTTADVRSAFSLRGLALPRTATATTGLTLAGGAPGLYVFVGKHDSDAVRRDAGGYERRVGNVLVHYGGADRGVLVRVRAAAAALAG
jgi:hypothetical protein